MSSEPVEITTPLDRGGLVTAKYDDTDHALKSAQNDVEVAKAYEQACLGRNVEYSLLRMRRIKSWRFGYLKETGPPRVSLQPIWNWKSWSHFQVGIMWRMTMHMLIIMKKPVDET